MPFITWNASLCRAVEWSSWLQWAIDTANQVGVCVCVSVRCYVCERLFYKMGGLRKGVQWAIEPSAKDICFFCVCVCDGARAAIEQQSIFACLRFKEGGGKAVGVRVCVCVCVSVRCYVYERHCVYGSCMYVDGGPGHSI